MHVIIPSGMGHSGSRDSNSGATVSSAASVISELNETADDIPMRIETLMREKYDIISEELDAVPGSSASHELAQKRDSIQAEIDDISAKYSTHARMSITTFTPWRYDIRQHFEIQRPSSPSQFERFKNTISITKLDGDFGSNLNMLFVDCPDSDPACSDLLRLVSSPLMEMMIDREQIDMAAQCGRICFVNFRSALWNQSYTIVTYIQTSIINLLCSLFNGQVVDGIPFTIHEPGKFREFRDWFDQVSKLTVSGTISEFRRLTRIAFRVHRTCPIVMILAGMDAVSDEEFQQLVQEDLALSQRHLIFLCQGNRKRNWSGKLGRIDRPISRSSISYTHSEIKPRSKRRRFARRIKSRPVS
jgi:hypothetical protein